MIKVDKASFNSIPQWINEVRTIRGNETIILIVGNKMDIQDKRQVTEDEGKSLAKEHNAMHFESSAKTGENVNNIFTKMSSVLPGIQATPPEPQIQSKPPTQMGFLNLEPAANQPKVNLANPADVLNQNAGKKGCCG